MARLKSGSDLKTLTAAAALANARTFGGEDYVGYHSFMALAPAYAMARELPKELAPLPVLKVIHRNTNRIQEKGGRSPRCCIPSNLPKRSRICEHPLSGARGPPMPCSPNAFLRRSIKTRPGEAYNHLQYSVQDAINVHRVVLSWRSWETLDFVGRENAMTLLRQSVRFCANEEQYYKKHDHEPEIRQLLPKLMDGYKLLSKPAGQAEDG